MTDIKDATKKELEAELKKRESAELAKTNKPPPRFMGPNIGGLCSYIEEMLSEAIKDTYLDADFPDFVYEKTMTTLYGDNIWEYMAALRKRCGQ